MKHSANIDRLRVATPCPISWEQMTGNARVRFCDHCQLNVYNISELGRAEAETLIASTEGRICARLYRRADGSVLTKDCPVGLRALRLRVSKRAAAVFAAIVSLAGAAFGQQASGQASNQEAKTGCTPQVKIARTSAASDPKARIVSGTVVDPAGAAIPGAKVVMKSIATKQIWETGTTDEGRFEFGPVPDGDYSIAVELLYFKSLEISKITVENGQLLNLDLILEPAQVGVTVGVLMAEPSLIETPPGTIINEKMIRRLPIQK
jgi:hypothetical protein